MLYLVLLTLAVAHANIAPQCKQSYMGTEYRGSQTHTRAGLICQRWDSQFPHAHNYTKAALFPDVTVLDAANHCRNPEGRWNFLGTWCFTTDPDVRWQYCNIPRCSDFPECRLTEKGIEYKGHIDVTSSGRKCALWQDGTGEKNYCRNPDGRESGPYCFVQDGEANETESCAIPFCKPAMHCKRTVKGLEYSGKISVTVNGKTCQRWVDQYPHSHTDTDPDHFPDMSLEEADKYCRNPDDSPEGPWCYTKDPNTRREPCNIKICQDCKLSETGREYSGGLAKTSSGEACERWDSHLVRDITRYPDVDLKAAENFCRNPDNDPKGPWCFVGSEKRYCDIPMCKGKTGNKVHVPRAKHIIHIGVDGLRPDCIDGAPGGAPNIMEKMVKEGTYTLKKATTSLVTVSSPGWSTTLCGMNIELTGITSNAWLPPWRGHKQAITPVTGNEHELPCIFHELKSQDPSIRTGSFYTWEWIRQMSNQGFPGDVDVEGVCPLPFVLCDELNIWRLRSYLLDVFRSAEKSYTYFYIGNVDVFGHTFGWCGFMYNWSVGAADHEIGVVLDTIKDASMEDETVVIVNSDHGGLDHDHGRQDDVDLQVPMFIMGAGIKKGHEFKRDVRNEDIVPTIADMLGLKPNPYWSGRPMSEAYKED